MRQVAVRLWALPPEAPFWEPLREELERAGEQRQVAKVEDVLARFKK